MNNLRINSKQSLIKLETLLTELPISTPGLQHITNARTAASNIMQGKDHRLLVIVGPCSIHDPIAALEYASLLKTAADRFANELHLVMRVYFEKPRTTLGWKGLINDPFLNQSFDINNGLKIARKLLLDLNCIGISTATEFLDPIAFHYFYDLITWGAIGARTVASPTHRELVSALPMPVGFKNSIDGNIKLAVEAVKVASHPHFILSLDHQGSTQIVQTMGNNDCHIVLRGSDVGSNYETSHIQQAVSLLEQAQLPPFIMVDCSHGNSMKNYELQHQVVQSVCEQLAQGSPHVRGIMLESHLVAGKQSSQLPLTFGQSITDGCISFENTLILLEQLADSVSILGHSRSIFVSESEAIQTLLT